MPTQRKVAVLVGSLRRESFTRKVALALMVLAPSELEMEIVEIGGVSLYNQDLEPTPPPDWIQFRDKVRSADALLFATPSTIARYPVFSRTPSTSDHGRERAACSTGNPAR